MDEAARMVVASCDEQTRGRDGRDDERAHEAARVGPEPPLRGEQRQHDERDGDRPAGNAERPQRVGPGADERSCHSGRRIDGKAHRAVRGRLPVSPFQP